MAKYKRSSSIMAADPQDLLLEYVKTNNIREITKLVENNKEFLHMEYPNSLTILEVACYEHADDVNAETIHTLIKLGADPTRIFEEWGYQSALHLATLGQNPQILETILSQKQVEVNSTAEEKSALQLLITDAKPKAKMKECVEILWRHGIDLHITDEKNNTALYYAAKQKYNDIVKFILSKDNTVTSKEADALRKLDPSLKFVIDDEAQTQNGMDYLKRRSETGFISWYGTHSDFDEETMEKSFLQVACEKHLLQALDFLIDRDPNKVGKTNKTHPLIIAVQNGYYEIVERLINARNIEIPTNLLNESLKRIDWDASRNVDYQRTCEILIESPHVDVNEKDNITSNYPLHYAVKYATKPIVRNLLNRKPSLANRDRFNCLTVTDIDHDILKEHFDSCIEAHPSDEKDQNRENMYLTFDFTTLFPTECSGESAPNFEGKILQTVVKESDVVLYMSKDKELKPLLQHPLIVSFLYVKWHQVRFLFLTNLLIYLLFCFSLLWFILDNYQEQEKVHLNTPYILLFITTVLITIREGFQVVFMVKEYVKNTDNWVEVGLLIDVYIMLFYPSTDKERRPMFAIAILLAALELLFLLGSVPGMSTYIVMLRTVSYNFVKFLLFNAILILAFAFSFYTLFRKVPRNDEVAEQSETPTKDPENEEKTEFFSSIYLALFKTLVMLTGEFEAGELDFDQYPIASHLIFMMFVILIAIILLNLLNGLAVSDTQEIKSEAKLVALTARAQYVSYVESMVFGNVLPSSCSREMCNCSPRSISTWSRWWLTRVCIAPQLQDASILKVYPNREGLIVGTGSKMCKCIFGGENIDENTIKAAKAIVAEREHEEEEKDNMQYKNLYALIQKLTQQLKSIEEKL